MYEIIRIAPTRHQNPRTTKIRNSMDIFLRCSLPFWYPMLHTTQYPSRDRRRLSNLELVDNAANARKTLYLIRMKVHDLERSNAQSSYNGFSPRPKYWNCKQLSWFSATRNRWNCLILRIPNLFSGIVISAKIVNSLSNSRCKQERLTNFYFSCSSLTARVRNARVLQGGNINCWNWL